MDALEPRRKSLTLVRDLVLIPIVICEGEADIFHRLRTEHRAFAPREPLLLIGPIDELRKIIDGFFVLAAAIKGPSDLIEREVVILIVGPLKDLLVGAIGEIEAVQIDIIVKMVFADSEPGLGDEARALAYRFTAFISIDELAPHPGHRLVEMESRMPRPVRALFTGERLGRRVRIGEFIRADEREPCLERFANARHLIETIADEIIDAVDTLILRILAEQAFIEIDDGHEIRLRAALIAGIFTAIERVLNLIDAALRVVAGALKIKLAEAEHRVGRIFIGVGIALNEALEFTDRGFARGGEAIGFGVDSLAVKKAPSASLAEIIPL